MENLNLYLVKSRGFRSYVVAKDTDAAWERFNNFLSERDYGYFWEREFSSIELIARTDTSSPKTESGCSFDDSQKDDLILI